jgi:hypothetical protein
VGVCTSLTGDEGVYEALVEGATSSPSCDQFWPRLGDGDLWP